MKIGYTPTRNLCNKYLKGIDKDYELLTQIIFGVTGWILVLKISKYDLPLLGLAALFYLFSRSQKSPSHRYTAALARSWLMGVE